MLEQRIFPEGTHTTLKVDVSPEELSLIQWHLSNLLQDFLRQEITQAGITGAAEVLNFVSYVAPTVGDYKAIYEDVIQSKESIQKYRDQQARKRK